MAMSHICLTCGLDLARVRPFHDSHYGLPLIVCPQCGTATARRKHPLVVCWRRFCRVIRALLAVALQLLTLGGLTALTMVFCIIAAHDVIRGRLPGPDDSVGRPIVLGLVALLSVGIGAWLTIGLAHWRRWVAWAAFSACVAALMSLDVLVAPFVISMLDRSLVGHIHLLFRPELWYIRLALLAAMMVVAVVGVPAGGALRRVWQVVSRNRWKARRRRIRRRRNA